MERVTLTKPNVFFEPSPNVHFDIWWTNKMTQLPCVHCTVLIDRVRNVFLFIFWYLYAIVWFCMYGKSTANMYFFKINI